MGYALQDWGYEFMLEFTTPNPQPATRNLISHVYDAI